jgi:hypothetical protein
VLTGPAIPLPPGVQLVIAGRVRELVPGAPDSCPQGTFSVAVLSASYGDPMRAGNTYYRVNNKTHSISALSILTCAPATQAMFSVSRNIGEDGDARQR